MTVELTEHAAVLLSDLIDFTEKESGELVEEALVNLTHAYNGTSPFEEE